MKFQGLIVTAILIGLFAFSLMTFVVQIETDNNSSTSILENDIINNSYIHFETNLSEVQNTSQDQKQGFETDSFILGTDSFLFTSIIGAGRVFTGIWRSMYALTFGLFGFFIIILLGSYFSQRRLETKSSFLSSFAVAGWITTVLAAIMSLIPNFVNMYTIIVCLVVSIVSTALLLFNREE